MAVSLLMRPRILLRHAACTISSVSTVASWRTRALSTLTTSDPSSVEFWRRLYFEKDAAVSQALAAKDAAVSQALAAKDAKDAAVSQALAAKDAALSQALAAKAEVVAITEAAKAEVVAITVAAKDEVVAAKDEVVAAKDEVGAAKDRVNTLENQLRNSKLQEQKLSVRFVLEVIADEQRARMRTTQGESAAQKKITTTEALNDFARSREFLGEVAKAIPTEEKRKIVISAFKNLMAFSSMHHHQFLEVLAIPDPDGVFHTEEQRISFECACRAAGINQQLVDDVVPKDV